MSELTEFEKKLLDRILEKAFDEAYYSDAPVIAEIARKLKREELADRLENSEVEINW